ncbi:MAG: type II secretion system protein [Verrucomicrobiota bacterium]
MSQTQPTNELNPKSEMKLNKNNKGTIGSTLQAGFSLVEMLVVIAVIGVIAAIAVPNISSLTSSADDAKNKRNAQNLSSVAAAAAAAGYDFVYPSGDDSGTALTDAADVVTAIVTGATVSGGSFDGTFFGVPNMSATEQTGAITYLVLADNTLKYNG